MWKNIPHYVAIGDETVVSIIEKDEEKNIETLLWIFLNNICF